jgi:hypothetical protein
MGRRHLVGLLRAGYDVIGSDPNPTSIEAAHQCVREEGFEPRRFDGQPVEGPIRFAVALFAETAPHRLQALRNFLMAHSADRILLEKPLTNDPRKAEAFLSLLDEHCVDKEQVFVNLTLRTLPLFCELQPLCRASREITLTLNGGAKGLGCNALHYLDLFLALTSEEPATVQWARLNEERLASRRGPDFFDFGGEFLVKGQRGTFFGSLSAHSSAAPVLSLRGDHFLATVDEGTQSFVLRCRDSESKKPVTLYGQDYSGLVEGAIEGTDHATLTERWAKRQITLPTIAMALRSHALLFGLLSTGGAKPPYHFT